ncbi:TIR domain-containing protein [Pseudoduganella sp. FT26W]|uniref:TIR domain-containing protein n=1 Tax=Duganella aquatilis TaxID=2666082 RepID=A0A844D9M2_9BURK|nr:toll/interleukin-1 receptor domain-containing protein [Duganella aquatilis]MRW83724.1 TIR domain-containing protein [Duganella aquatilis]
MMFLSQSLPHLKPLTPMKNPVRAFLSHSSKDKFLINGIYKQLSAAHVHYDEATFEKGETSASEIFEALKNSDVFVLFLSENSVESRWVQTEMTLSQHYFFNGRIKKILVFILDDVDVDLIPEWLKTFIYHKTSMPGVIVTSIRSALFDISLSNNSSLSLFMGRDKEIGVVKDKLSDLTQNAPSALFFGGSEGIGRRTLAKRALKDVHPQIINFPVEITLGDKEGDIEFYRYLLAQGENLPILQTIEKIEKYQVLDFDDRIIEIVNLIEKISDQRQIIFLRGKDAIVLDDGFLSDWLGAVVAKLKDSPWPKLVLIARRVVSPAKRFKYPGMAFFPVNSLDISDSRKLLAIWLKHLQADVDQSLSDEIVEFVSGHPKNIQLAATLAAEFGSARLKTERIVFLDAIRQQAKALLDGLSINSEREQILALFREYEYLSSEDLLVALGDVDETALATTMSYLNEHGIVEADGPYLRLAPYLLDALSRFNWSENAKTFVLKCRDRILNRVEKFSTQDYVDISTIDNVILSILRQNKEVENVLLSRCLLPSHILRVAREFYDRKDFSKSLELANKAFDGRGKLSTEAQIEALRLVCLSCVRLGEDDNLFEAIGHLERFGERLAKRTAAFVRGFKARYEGKLDVAETHFRLAYSLGGDRNFHILRELAQISKLKEEYAEAENFARTAFDIADRNPYIIDTLLEIIIERHRDDYAFLRDNSELVQLFNSLQETARKEKKSFYESRRAHLFSSLKETENALEWAKRATETTPHHLPVQLTLAKIQINVGEVSDAKKTLDKVSKQIRSAGSNADRRSIGELDKLTILANIQGQNFIKARETLRQAHSLPKDLREILAKKIDIAEAHSSK